MRIFVTGATGYIGFEVASALGRAGYEVWGLARSPEKATALAAAEIRPVLGTLQNPGDWREAAEECSVLVHAAADSQGDTLAVDAQTVDVLLAAARLGPQPTTLVYTSSVWVYGSTGEKLVDETTPTNPVRIASRRPATERKILNAEGIRALVIRPGCVYGRRGGLTAMWFHGAANERALGCVGDGSNRWAMVHADDLADLYVRAIDSGIAGEVFNATDRSRATVSEMLRAVARVTGFAGEIRHVPLREAHEAMGDFAECLAVDQHVDSRKAVRRLGWQPKHGGFVDGAATYFEAWQALQAT
jgi:nucleoside-diphosphate-sugar epimerase